MPTRTSLIRLAAVLVASAALTAACGSSSASDSIDTTGSVSIVSPADGAVVSGPVEIQMASEDFEIEPAGEVRVGAGHLHLMIDVDCVEPGQVIPADGSHLHFGDGSTTTTLDLPAGEYTLCLQAGDGVHTALDLTDSVTFTVAP